MLHKVGVETGVNLAKPIECAKLAQEFIGRPLENHVARFGLVKHRASA